MGFPLAALEVLSFLLPSWNASCRCVSDDLWPAPAIVLALNCNNGSPPQAPEKSLDRNSENNQFCKDRHSDSPPLGPALRPLINKQHFEGMNKHYPGGPASKKYVILHDAKMQPQLKRNFEFQMRSRIFAHRYAFLGCPALRSH